MSPASSARSASDKVPCSSASCRSWKRLRLVSSHMVNLPLCFMVAGRPVERNSDYAGRASTAYSEHMEDWLFRRLRIGALPQPLGGPSRPAAGVAGGRGLSVVCFVSCSVARAHQYRNSGEIWVSCASALLEERLHPVREPPPV